MGRLLRLLLALAVTACASPAPYATIVGILSPGSAIAVHVKRADLDAFAPATGQPRTRFTIEATAAGKDQPPAPHVIPTKTGITLEAPDPLASLLVRVPDGVSLEVTSENGDVRVTNISGSASVDAKHGNVQIIVPSYAQAQVGSGNLSVTMGATVWPGTLTFATQRGDVEVWINETAKFHAYLHTDDGTLFTDFDLRGTSQGSAETIDADVNGGSNQRIVIRTNAGAVRLLKLHPEA